jgi:hypothetical protein
MAVVKDLDAIGNLTPCLLTGFVTALVNHPGFFISL